MFKKELSVLNFWAGRLLKSVCPESQFQINCDVRHKCCVIYNNQWHFSLSTQLHYWC